VYACAGLEGRGGGGGYLPVFLIDSTLASCALEFGFIMQFSRADIWNSWQGGWEVLEGRGCLHVVLIASALSLLCAGNDFLGDPLNTSDIGVVRRQQSPLLLCIIPDLEKETNNQLSGDWWPAYDDVLHILCIRACTFWGHHPSADVTTSLLLTESP